MQSYGEVKVPLHSTVTSELDENGYLYGPAALPLERNEVVIE